MSAHVPALPLELDPLIAEAKQRARRRRFILLVGVVALAAVSAAVTLRGFGEPRPALTAATSCRTAQLHVSLTSGGVAGGTVGDAFTFANTSRAVCVLSGWPRFRLVMGDGKVVRPRPHDLIASAYSVKNPPPVPRVRLAPGATVHWILEAADGTGLPRMCPTAERLLLTPPGAHVALAVAARVPYCGPRYFWTFPIGRSY